MNYFEKLPYNVIDKARLNKNGGREISFEWQEQWLPVENVGSEKSRNNVISSLGELNDENYSLFPQTLVTYFADIESQKARLFEITNVYQESIRKFRGGKIVMVTALFDRNILDFINEVKVKADLPGTRNMGNVNLEKAYGEMETNGTAALESYCQIFFGTSKDILPDTSLAWVLGLIRQVNEKLDAMHLPLLPEPGENIYSFSPQ